MRALSGHYAKLLTDSNSHWPPLRARIYFTNYCYSHTNDALSTLGVSSTNYLSRIHTAVVPTAVLLLVFGVLIWFLGMWRGFIEAAHDTTGGGEVGGL